MNAVIGAGAYAKTPGAGKSSVTKHQQETIQAGNGMGADDTSAPTASECQQPCSTQRGHMPLWPVRLVLAYLQHLRKHGLEEWRWQELRSVRAHQMMCASLDMLDPTCAQTLSLLPHCNKIILRVCQDRQGNHGSIALEHCLTCFLARAVATQANSLY